MFDVYLCSSDRSAVEYSLDLKDQVNVRQQSATFTRLCTLKWVT
jgi:hypothetical protein